MVQQYLRAGAPLSTVETAPEAGIQAAQQLFSGGRVKVFSTCQKTLAQMRSFWKNEDGSAPKKGYLLMECFRMLCLHKERMKTKPELPKRVAPRSTDGRGWMT